MTDRPALTLGIEEEYLIVDQETRDLVTEPPRAFVEACQARLGDQVTGEFLQCQIEVGTKPHRAVPDAIAELRSLRDGIKETAQAFGFAPIAASTHPFSKWRDQQRTDKDRYEGLERDMGRVVGRMLICGMHIHVGIEDDDLRIDMMNQATYFLPHLLALSCSSPFWEGDDTGLASYRLSVFDAMPRTGLPDAMDSHAEYRRMVESLVAANCIEDATKIWWDIRPSDKFPTLEQRITDICTRLEDTATLAAIYQCVIAYLYRIKSRNQRWRLYPRTLIMENRWRAQRFGATGDLLDLGRTSLVPTMDLVEELIDMLAPEAEMLGCHRELLHARQIVRDGTSSEKQRKILEQALKEGLPRSEAMAAVVDHLISEF